MAKPTKYLDWTDGATSKVLEPSAGKKSIGFQIGEKPPFRFINWLFHKIDQDIKSLDDIIDNPRANIIEIYSDYTLDNSIDIILVDASSGNITISLPQASLVTKKIYRIIRVDDSSNSVVIDPYPIELIDGNLTYSLKYSYAFISIISINNGWQIISKMITPNIEITSINPAWGTLSGGEEITIEGKNFYNNSKLKLGNTIIPYTKESTSKIKFIVPSNPIRENKDVSIIYHNIESKIQNGFSYVRTLGQFVASDSPPINSPHSAFFRNSRLFSLNGNLYCAYDTTTDSHLFLKKYNNDDDNPSWTYTEGQNDNQGYESANFKGLKDGIIFNDKIYLGIYDYISGKDLVRVGEYTPTLGWNYIDGGSLNINPSASAREPRLFIYNNNLYCVFYEQDVMVWKIRVKRYDGGTTWTIVDNGGLNYDMNQTADSHSAINFNNEAYVFFIQDRSDGYYYLGVKKYDGTNWIPVDGGSGIGLNTNDFSKCSKYHAFISNNNLYVITSEYDISTTYYLKKYLGGTLWNKSVWSNSSFYPEFLFNDDNVGYFSIDDYSKKNIYINTDIEIPQFNLFIDQFDLVFCDGSFIYKSAVNHNNKLYLMWHEQNYLSDFYNFVCRVLI